MSKLMMKASEVAEIMINAFGCGFSEGYGNDFDISKLRYHKIILMQNMGQKHLSPNTSSIILSFESVFGLMFSVIFLGDPVTLKLGAGCVLMFASVILSEYKKKGTAIS